VTLAGIIAAGWVGIILGVAAAVALRRAVRLEKIPPRLLVKLVWPGLDIQAKVPPIGTPEQRRRKFRLVGREEGDDRR